MPATVAGRSARWVALESTARSEPNVAPGAVREAPLLAGLCVRRGPKDRTLERVLRGPVRRRVRQCKEESDYSSAHAQMPPPRWGACQYPLMSHYSHLRVPVLYRVAALKYWIRSSINAGQTETRMSDIKSQYLIIIRVSVPVHNQLLK